MKETTAKCRVCGSTDISFGFLNLDIRPHRDGIGKPCLAAGLPFAIATKRQDVA